MLQYLRLSLLILLVAIILGFYLTGGAKFLRLEFLQGELDRLREIYLERPLVVLSVLAGGIYFLTTVSIPGSFVLTLLTGAVLGPLRGTLLVCLASTLGAASAFLISRFLLRGFVMRKFRRQHELMERSFKREGNSYLFSLRIVPISPFVVVNLVMGTLSLPIWTFTWVTFLGMLPGTFIYVWAGKEFSRLDSLKGLLPWPVLLALTGLGLLPFIFKWARRRQINSYHSLKEEIMQNHRNSFYTVSGVEFEGEDLAHFTEEGSPHDSQLRTLALERIRQHPELGSETIEVSVENGTVFLRGLVSDASQREQAHDCVTDIKGVSEVINQLSLRTRQQSI